MSHRTDQKRLNLYSARSGLRVTYNPFTETARIRDAGDFILSDEVLAYPAGEAVEETSFSILVNVASDPSHFCSGGEDPDSYIGRSTQVTIAGSPWYAFAEVSAGEGVNEVVIFQFTDGKPELIDSLEGKAFHQIDRDLTPFSIEVNKGT